MVFTEPEVSIIILNWNGLEDTIECLESLKKITYSNYQVIVVDNGSKSNDADILEDKYKDYIKLIRNDKNYGFTGGNNIAIKRLLEISDFHYCLLLNNDTVVAPEFLTEMVKAMESDSRTGIAGCKTFLYHTPNLLQLVWFDLNMRTGRANWVGAGEVDRGQYEDIREVAYVQGSCFLIKKEVIERIGMLDEVYGNYFEEVDYCLRARKVGYTTVYVPKAHIWHHKEAQSDNEARGRREYYLTRNRFLLMKRHATRCQFALFLLSFFFRDFWYENAWILIDYKDISMLRSFYKGIKDGLLMLPVTPRLE